MRLARIPYLKVIKYALAVGWAGAIIAAAVSAGGYHSEGGAGLSTEEEQTCILACRLLLLLFTVERVEHGVTVIHIVDHAVERANNRLRIHVAVIRQKRTDTSEAHVFVISTAIPWQ